LIILVPGVAVNSINVTLESRGHSAVLITNPLKHFLLSNLKFLEEFRNVIIIVGVYVGLQNGKKTLESRLSDDAICYFLLAMKKCSTLINKHKFSFFTVLRLIAIKSFLIMNVNCTKLLQLSECGCYHISTRAQRVLPQVLFAIEWTRMGSECKNAVRNYR
jgi:hypothetical protein